MSDGRPVILAFGRIKRLSSGTVIVDPVITGNLTVDGVIQADGVTLNPTATNPQTDPALAPNTLWNDSGVLMLGANPVAPTTALQEYIATAVWTPLQFLDVAGPGPDPLPMTSVLPADQRTVNFSRIGSQVTMQFAAALSFESGIAGDLSTYLFADMDLTIPTGFKPSDGLEDIAFTASEMTETNTNSLIVPELILFNAGGMRLRGTTLDRWRGNSQYEPQPATVVWSFSWLTEEPVPVPP